MLNTIPLCLILNLSVLKSFALELASEVGMLEETDVVSVPVTPMDMILCFQVPLIFKPNWNMRAYIPIAHML